MYMLYENKYIYNLQGGGVWGPRSRRNFKKSNKMEAFPVFFIFAFWQGSLDPQNYELAPQPPLNNYQCSLDP